MQYIESPSPVLTDPVSSVFLAGGITGCPDWQQEMCGKLDDSGFGGRVYNPRRADFPIHDPNAALAQITWEYYALEQSDAISFWFAKETIQPIVLFELGRWSGKNKPIFVGVHPEYPRRQDVEIQMKLARPEVLIVQTLVELTSQVCDWERAQLTSD